MSRVRDAMIPEPQTLEASASAQEAGERLRITVHGHPVAELVPIRRSQQFVPFDELVNGLQGLMRTDDRLDQELRQVDEPPRDPFA